MKKAIFITLLFPLLIKAQINSEQEVSLIDTVYYDYRHGMFKTACFVEKYTRWKVICLRKVIFSWFEKDLKSQFKVILYSLINGFIMNTA